MPICLYTLYECSDVLTRTLQISVPPAHAPRYFVDKASMRSPLQAVCVCLQVTIGRSLLIVLVCDLQVTPCVCMCARARLYNRWTDFDDVLLKHGATHPRSIRGKFAVVISLKTFGSWRTPTVTVLCGNPTDTRFIFQCLFVRARAVGLHRRCDILGG